MIKLLYLLRGVVSLSIVTFLSEYDVEDSMRATACLIHVGGSHSPAETVNTFISLCGKLFVCPCVSATRGRVLLWVFELTNHSTTNVDTTNTITKYY